MKKSIFCLIILFLASVSFAEERQAPVPLQKEKCAACGMFVSMFADWNTSIEFADSTQAVFDGPKCMFKYYLNMERYYPSKSRSAVTAVYVKDYNSKATIDALRVFFVIWSEVYGPMGHEPIPFEKEDDAEEFMKEHKGNKILRFGDVTPAVILSLDNP